MEYPSFPGHVCWPRADAGLHRQPFPGLQAPTPCLLYGMSFDPPCCLIRCPITVTFCLLGLRARWQLKHSVLFLRMAPHPTDSAALCSSGVPGWDESGTFNPHSPASLTFLRHSHPSVLGSPGQNVNRKWRKVLGTLTLPASPLPCALTE